MRLRVTAGCSTSITFANVDYKLRTDRLVWMLGYVGFEFLCNYMQSINQEYGDHGERKERSNGLSLSDPQGVNEPQSRFTAGCQ